MIIITRLDYNKVNYNVSVGTQSYGWTMIKEYEHHNLWIKTTRSGEKIRTSFFKNEIPNQYASYTYDD